MAFERDTESAFLVLIVLYMVYFEQLQFPLNPCRGTQACSKSDLS